MKIKLFDNFTENDNYKNKILLIDASGSFAYAVYGMVKEKLYLTDKFSVIFASSYEIYFRENIDINQLYQITKDYNNYGGDGMQEGINFIVNHELEGAVIVITDGNIAIDISHLSNDISIIYTQLKPTIIGGECRIFQNRIIGTEYYPPRDCKSIEEYEAYKMSKKYNI